MKNPDSTTQGRVRNAGAAMKRRRRRFSITEIEQLTISPQEREARQNSTVSSGRYELMVGFYIWNTKSS
jgi:hypothetical protein